MRPHVVVWETHFTLPTTCAFCDNEITRWGSRGDDGVVHHVDQDRSNNDIENLVAMHRRCHVAHHSLLRNYGPVSSEARAKISASLTGRKLSGQHRRNISRSLIGHRRNVGRVQPAAEREKRASTLRGRFRSAATRAKISETMIGTSYGYVDCESCGRRVGSRWLRRHKCS